MRKEVVRSFLKMAERGSYQEAYHQFIAPEFKHHNVYFKGDRESLLNAMQESAKESPNEKIEVKQIFEDGETVITHSQVLRKDQSLQPIVVIHIWKFKGDKIVELWDVGQELPKESPNENGPF